MATLQKAGANRIQRHPDSSSSDQQYDIHSSPDEDGGTDEEIELVGHQDPFADAEVVSSDSETEAMPSTLPPQAAPRTEPRQKMSRSATSHSPTISAPSNPNRPRRTMSEDSSSQDLRAARAANTRTKSHGVVPLAKDKPSQHADVIDKLDISGVAGGMFHHDGPFDACAPSRNKSTKPHRAPMHAFDGSTDGAPHNVPVMDKRLSPLAQATIAAMAATDGPYPSASLMPMTASENINDTMPRGPGMLNGRLGPSTRKMTLTEAWGRGEPEPFEEFSAGTIGQHGAHGSARSSLDGDLGSYETYQRRAERGNVGRRGESLDLPTRRATTKIPPPQPIILPGARTPGPDPNAGNGESSPTYNSDVSPTKPKVQRTKSLMQRFRRMRENPNVPVGGGGAADAGYFSEGPHSPREAGWTPGPKPAAVPEEPEPTPSPLEKPPLPKSYSQTRAPAREHGQRQYRAQPRSPRSPDEPFVVVDSATAVAASREKALPPPPSAYPAEADNGYFDRAGGADVGRKTSLYRKVKGVVAGGGKAK